MLWKSRSAAARTRLLLTLLTFTAVLGAREVNGAQLTASWVDNSNAVATTRLERRLATDVTFAAIADVPPGVTEFIDPSLSPGTTYCYRALAYDADGVSPYSDEVCATSSNQGYELNVTIRQAGTGAGTVASTLRDHLRGDLRRRHLRDPGRDPRHRLRVHRLERRRRRRHRNLHPRWQRPGRGDGQLQPRDLPSHRRHRGTGYRHQQSCRNQLRLRLLRDVPQRRVAHAHRHAEQKCPLHRLAGRQLLGNGPHLHHHHERRQGRLGHVLAQGRVHQMMRVTPLGVTFGSATLQDVAPGRAGKEPATVSWSPRPRHGPSDTICWLGGGCGSDRGRRGGA